MRFRRNPSKSSFNVRRSVLSMISIKVQLTPSWPSFAPEPPSPSSSSASSLAAPLAAALDESGCGFRGASFFRPSTVSFRARPRVYATVGTLLRNSTRFNAIAKRERTILSPPRRLHFRQRRNRSEFQEERRNITRPSTSIHVRSILRDARSTTRRHDCA